ncbi:conserved hypothetical protein [Talaromyces stipitatus ATCC 10500]|uniref:beta-glucosidase n=1 Tax=Talaromyces stipitatus (strain ATCC 10500 / CBS 375.48 / QM 6759 / NRRL 1006) TaxID=441959 RepID=B8LV87_TALSN|nr:uncharacterized protein TSTA_065900 [Talaromyces stipitatus ATCC 10500]EED23137.1 conserved hypothetical protein [Talaromyces stipitatus ATCC 10500]
MDKIQSSSVTPPYRQKELPVEERVEDLLNRMQLDEKAGQLFLDTIQPAPNGNIGVESPLSLICSKRMSAFSIGGPIENAREIALWINRLQEYAMESRLGIPIILAFDPRNHFSEDNIATGWRPGAFSQWPEPLGLAALRSPELIERFTAVVRQEYVAAGIRLALHPQIDLATEPRWSRIGATFGEDADLTARLVEGCIGGLQGRSTTLQEGSVSCTTKHFPGGGPQLDGEDPHFEFGREQVYSGNSWEYHLKPFRNAIRAGTSRIMPYYGLPVGTKYEQVGFAFNRGVITELLREELGFNGIVCTDWGLITDKKIFGEEMPARAWGVEHLTELERVARLLEAGCDQLGGEARPELIVELVQSGRISEKRIDESVRRLLREKFLLGLFDNPFVDVDMAEKIVGNASFRAEGENAQRRSFTLLTNTHRVLPLSAEVQTTKKFYIEGINRLAAEERNMTVVEKPEEADVALLRLKAPFERRPGKFQALFHCGRLDFPAEEQSRQQAIYKTVPLVIVDLYLDRPAVVPEVAEQASAFMVNYGSSDRAFLDIVFAERGATPEGKLPFDMPRSMEAVTNSKEDLPFDTKDPIFKFGHGLHY